MVDLTQYENRLLTAYPNPIFLYISSSNKLEFLFAFNKEIQTYLNLSSSIGPPKALEALTNRQPASGSREHFVVANTFQTASQVLPDDRTLCRGFTHYQQVIIVHISPYS
jgi:hypothetical protein